MQGSKKQDKSKKASNGKSEGRLDILFGGPLVFVPEIVAGAVAGVEIFSPSNGHPVGAVFVPGVWFTDAELNDPESTRWPAASSFALLDPHGYSIDLTQKGKHAPFPVAEIPATNHKVNPGRRLSADWAVAIKIHGQLSGWGSQRLFRVTPDLYVGGDLPSSTLVAGMHRLTYTGVTGAEFSGASTNPRAYLRAHAAQGGSLIVTGEIPYQASLRHEREAVDALARLAGIDLHLVATEPQPHKSRLMNHVHDCGHSLVIAPIS